MNWLREHWRALLSALARVRGAPGGFVFNAVVIALALVLPLTGLTVLENLRPVARDLAVEPELSVFLSTDVARSRAQAIADERRHIYRASGWRARPTHGRQLLLARRRHLAPLVAVDAAAAAAECFDRRTGHDLVHDGTEGDDAAPPQAVRGRTGARRCSSTV